MGPLAAAVPQRQSHPITTIAITIVGGEEREA
jgi:hypothetical protein